MERELLEQVVVETGAGCDAHATGAVEPEPHAHRRLRRRADVPRRCDPAARSSPASAASRRSSSSRSRTVMRMPSARDAHDAAAREQALGDLRRRRRVGHEDEVRARRQRLEAERAQLAGEPLALLDDRGDVGRRAQRGERERDGERRDGGGRLACAQLRGGVARREQVADARAGERERLREGADDDHAVVDERHRGLARVLEVRLVDDERPRRRAAAARSPSGLPGRQQNVRTGLVVADRRAGELGRDAEERIRRRPAAPPRRRRARRTRGRTAG